MIRARWPEIRIQAASLDGIKPSAGLQEVSSECAGWLVSMRWERQLQMCAGAAQR